NPGAVSIAPSQPQSLFAVIAPLPQAQAKPRLLNPEIPTVPDYFRISHPGQLKDSQLRAFTAEDCVIRHSQDSLVDFPLCWRMVNITKRLSQVLFLRTGRKQFNNDQWRRAFLPVNIT